VPVHPVAGGFRFGETGKVFRSRAKAEAQARAVYASGWREDRARLIAHRALSASRKAETAYIGALLRIMSRVHAGVLHVVHREHLGVAPEPEHRHDARFVGLGDELLRKMFRYVKPQVQMAFDFMASEAKKKSEQGTELVGIRPRFVPGLAKVLEQARQKNVDLVTNASRDFLDDIRSTLEDHDGETAAEIAKALQERVGVSKSRAVLIATDQALKTHAALSHYRMQAAGVKSYRWSSSLDERVRPRHAELQGQVFSWEEPPETNDDGDTNHPGEDYRCRCVALPVLANLEAPDVEAEEPDEEEELPAAAAE